MLQAPPRWRRRSLAGDGVFAAETAFLSARSLSIVLLCRSVFSLSNWQAMFTTRYPDQRIHPFSAHVLAHRDQDSCGDFLMVWHLVVCHSSGARNGTWSTVTILSIACCRRCARRTSPMWRSGCMTCVVAVVWYAAEISAKNQPSPLRCVLPRPFRPEDYAERVVPDHALPAACGQQAIREKSASIERLQAEQDQPWPRSWSLPATCEAVLREYAPYRSYVTRPAMEWCSPRRWSCTAI